MPFDAMNYSTKMRIRGYIIISLMYIFLYVGNNRVQGSCAQYFYPTATEITADETIQYIQTPNYPDGVYDNDQRCQWHVTSGSAEGKIIINVMDFSSEGTNNGCPSKDYATIFDGGSSDANEIFRVCPGNVNERSVYISTTNEIFVQFTSDAFLTYSGISIAVFTNNTTNQPPTLTPTGTPQYLLSNNMPSAYEAIYQCVHTFTFTASPTENAIRFYFHLLDIEPSSSCVYASLTIAGGENISNLSTVYILCETAEMFFETAYIVTGTAAQLTFTTTSNVTTSTDYYGYYITYETAFDNCVSAPCNNDGNCTNTDSGFICTCQSGFEGTFCQTNIDDCAPNPCNNGGTCTDDVGGYTCTCTSGFQGSTCDTNIDDCLSTPCNNGGTCTDDVDGYSCTCTSGFQGSTCEISTVSISEDTTNDDVLPIVIYVSLTGLLFLVTTSVVMYRACNRRKNVYYIS